MPSIAEVRASLFAHRNPIGRLLDERPTAPEGGYSQAFADRRAGSRILIRAGVVDAVIARASCSSRIGWL